MLKRRMTLLMLIVVSNVVVVAGILAGVRVSTDTNNDSVTDFGGSPSVYCYGIADHQFSFTCDSVYYSYSTTVHHDGSYAGSDYHSGTEGGGPKTFYRTSIVSGSASNPTSQGHYTTGDHGSYIEDKDYPSDWDQDTETSYDYRSSD